MRVVVALLTNVLLVTLAGCTTAGGPKPPRTAPSEVTIHGTTSERRTLVAPPGTNSATIVMACQGTSLGMTVGTEQDARLTRCSSRRQVTVPVDGSLVLAIDPAQATGYDLHVRFSPVAFHQNPTVALQCRAASSAMSELASAVNGRLTGQLDPAGAQEDMRHAATDLLAAPADGPLGEDLVTLRAWLLANPTADPATAPPLNPTQTCADNESPLVVGSQYGG